MEHLDEYKTILITFLITTIGGWIAGTFSKTLKKINDSQDTKAKFDEHIKTYHEDIKEIKMEIRDIKNHILSSK